MHAKSFITAVGCELLDWLEKNELESLGHIALAFRSYMTDGMTSTQHCINRITFYQNVVKRAQAVSAFLLFVFVDQQLTPFIVYF